MERAVGRRGMLVGGLLVGAGGFGYLLATRGAEPPIVAVGRTAPPSADARAAASQAAQALAEALDRQWRFHEALAQSLQPLEPERDGAAIRSVLDQARVGLSHLTWIGVADAGTARVRAAAGGILEGADVGQRPWFSAGLGGDFAGDVHDAMLLQRALNRAEGDEPLRLVDFASPLRGASGAVTAVLGAHLEWEWIRTLVRESSARSGVPLALVSQAGNVIFGPAAAYGADLADRPSAHVVQAPDAPSFGWTVVALPGGARP